MKTDLDPSALYWATCGNTQFQIPGEAVQDIARPGPADEAVAYWAPEVRRLASELYADDPANPYAPTAERIREALQECGAWEADELSDEETNWRRAVWIAACDIAEDDEPDCAPPSPLGTAATHPNAADSDLALANALAASNATARNRNLAGLAETPPNSDLFQALAAAVFLESLGEPFPDVLACLQAGQGLADITANLIDSIRDNLP